MYFWPEDLSYKTKPILCCLCALHFYTNCFQLGLCDNTCVRYAWFVYVGLRCPVSCSWSAWSSFANLSA